jgi:general stress protein 26
MLGNGFQPLRGTASIMTSIEKLNEMISGIDIAMLTSVHAAGQLHSRPMATQAVSDDGFLWFFARQHSSKIDEIRNVHQVNVAYSDPVNMRFVSVSGPCELLRNRAIAAALWKPEYKRWFPQGMEDPDLILLKVTINSAEYWDTTAGRMRTLESENNTVGLRDERTEVA